MDRVEPNAGESSTTDAGPSFVELQRRISQIPDGPSGILETPKPYRILNVIGGVGALVALLPIVFAKLMTPRLWMINMMQHA